jgi:Electron transfer DM13
MIKKIIIGVVGLVVLGVAYYGISPLFRHTRIDEVAPPSKEIVTVPQGVAKVETEKTVSTLPSQKVDVMTKEVIAPVIGTIGHPGSGTARIITTENGDVIRYENFKTLNGPDLYVYLAKDLYAKEFVNLGELKATEGNVNYEVPQGTNVQDYRYVMVWCKQFGVLFNYADLSPQE